MYFVHLTFFLIYLDNLVLSYYFYNPVNRQLFKTSSKKFPNGYIRLRPPRNARRQGVAVKRRHRDSSGYCKDAGFVCDTPFDQAVTVIFECKADQQCPLSYKCCDQKCFQHKVCIKSSDFEDEECEKWPYTCSYPYPYSFSRRFRCNYDKQCPSNYKCCRQNCFIHKICSKKISSSSQKIPAPIAEIKKKPTTTTTSTTKQSWFNLLPENSVDTEENIQTTSEAIDTTIEENDTEAVDTTTTKQTEINEEESTVVQESTEITTTKSYEDIGENETEEQESASTTGAEDSQYEDEVDETSTVTTEKSTTSTETNYFTDKVTVLFLTPDPNSIESVLKENGPPPIIAEEDITSTRDPDYDDLYYNNEDDEEYDEEDS